MPTVKAEILKKLMDAKKFLYQGYIDEGIKLIQEVVSSAQKNDYNWFICNVIESVDCKTLFTVLDKVGNSFDIERCQNVKRIVECGIKVNIINQYVEKALDILVSQGKKDKLTELSKIALNGNEVSSTLLVKIAEALRKIGDEKEARNLLHEACRKGDQQACNSVNAITVRSIM